MENAIAADVQREEAGSWGRRLGEALAFVALYSALGFAIRRALPADSASNLYLVIGVPLTWLFQRYVARAPLRAAWILGAPPLRLDRRMLGLAALFALAPAISIGDAIAQRSPITALWAIAGSCGALGVAWTIRSIDRPALWRAVGAGLLAALPGIAVLILYLRADPPPPTEMALKMKQFAGVARVFVGLLSFAQYLPICFALEEVTFRGVLDAHVMRAQPDRARAWLTAAALSIAWGLWHAPIALDGKEPLLQALGEMIGITLVAGLALTSAFRRHRLLLAPAIAHALMDAVRNALLF